MPLLTVITIRLQAIKNIPRILIDKLTNQRCEQYAVRKISKTIHDKPNFFLNAVLIVAGTQAPTGV